MDLLEGQHIGDRRARRQTLYTCIIVYSARWFGVEMLACRGIVGEGELDVTFLSGGESAFTLPRLLLWPHD